MKRYLLLAAAVLASSAAIADDDDRAPVLVRFSGAVGSQPFANVGGTAQPNDVFTIPPGGRPWPIASFKAKIRVDGSIEAIGTGLILGGGGRVGTSGGVPQVSATLFCTTATAPNVPPAYNSPAVPLSLSGDFVIRAKLSPVPPNPCASPVLLVGPPGGPDGRIRAWFAAGIPAN